MTLRRLTALIASCLISSGAHASSLVVPDDVPTVQAALDSLVDTIFVRAANYPQAPVANLPERAVSLMAIAGEPGLERPVLGGLQVSLGSGRIEVHGFEFASRVTAYGDVTATMLLDDCHLTAGISIMNYDISGVTLRRCRVDGDATLQANGFDLVDSCTFTGQLSVYGGDCSLTVENSQFHGPGAGAAIIIPTEIREATILHNVIDGYRTGIGVTALDHPVRVEDNLVRNTAYTGISVWADAVQILRNQVVRCGGYGIYGQNGFGALLISDNTIEDCGAGGIYPCSGLYALNESSGTITGNVVRGSRSDGIYIASDATSNDGASLELRNNTSAFNNGSGFVMRGAVGVLNGNIGFGNSGYGVSWDIFSGAPGAHCNDWFENGLGASNGLPMSAEDFTLDPMFCAADTGDFHLHANSPLVDLAGCGLVGALGVGCDVAGVGSGRLAFRITTLGPSPSRGPVRIEFELPQPAAIELDLFDVLGRRVASAARGVWPAGRHAAELFASGDAARLPSGVYLVRYRYPGGETRRRLIRTR